MLVEFNKDDIIKEIDYPVNCVVGACDFQPVIRITHDECIFSSNDEICKAWTRIVDTFLRPKEQGQSIIVFEFLLPFGYLNLLSLSKKNREKSKTKPDLQL